MSDADATSRPALRENGLGCVFDQDDIDYLFGIFVNHYWDSLEGDKHLILNHIRSVIDYHFGEPSNADR